MRKHCLLSFSAATLVVLAGGVLHAQTNEPTKPRDIPTSPARTDTRSDNTLRMPDGNSRVSAASSQVVFVSADKMRGTEVFNSEHKSSGKIKDLVIERGSGRVTHLVVDPDSRMGLGERTVLIPFSAFSWDQTRKHLMVMPGAAKPANSPEFSSERWLNRADDQSSLAYALSNDYYRAAPDSRFETGDKPVQLRGKIKRIERTASTSGGGEDLVLTVVTDDNREEQVIVGPSWYLAGNGTSFFRDAPVDMYVSRRESDGKTRLIARSTSSASASGTNQTPLYDTEGWPMWDDSRRDTPSRPGQPSGGQPGAKSPETNQTLSSNRRTRIAPLVLATELDGKSLNCRNNECGKVDDLLVECVSGRVAFIVIDPDQNFLGIGDTNRLVPWAVVTAGPDNRLLLDADKAMIVSGVTLPKDLELFASDGSYRGVYNGYGVPVQSFDPNWNDRNSRGERDNMKMDARDADRARRDGSAPNKGAEPGNMPK